MLTRLCITVIIAGVAGGPACAQSLLLNKGEYGVFGQGGYTDLRNSGSAFELELGMAFSRWVELGVGMSGSEIRSTTRTAIVPFLSIYPLQTGEEDVTLIFGLHEVAGIDISNTAINTNSIGGSLNLVSYFSSKSGIVLSGGCFASSASGMSGMANSAIIGFGPFFKTEGGDPIGILFQYTFTEGPNTWGIGLSIGAAWHRTKN